MDLYLILSTNDVNENNEFEPKNLTFKLEQNMN